MHRQAHTPALRQCWQSALLPCETQQDIPMPLCAGSQAQPLMDPLGANTGTASVHAACNINMKTCGNS